MSQFQILGRRPFTFKAVSIRFACTNFSGSIPPVRLRRASSAVQTETQKLHLLAISAHEAAQHAVNGVAPEVGRHDRGQPLDPKTHVLGPLGYVYGIGRGERIRGEAVARRLRPTGRPRALPGEAAELLVTEDGESPARTRLAHLAQRAPLSDSHARRQAALHGPGPHVAPCSVPVDRRHKPPR